MENQKKDGTEQDEASKEGGDEKRSGSTLEMETLGGERAFKTAPLRRGGLKGRT